MPTANDGTVKVTFNLPAEEVAVMKSLAQRHSTTNTAVLRRALALEAFVANVIRDGGVILVRNRDGAISEVFIR